MKLIKNIYPLLVLGIVALTGTAVTSCNDSMHEESYYTFTGEYLSDYLQSHEDYSAFAEIVKRSANSTRGVDIMDLVSCYGQFTCFAPTNEAVNKYLSDNGYVSVSDIPYDVCDTIARTHMFNGVVYTTNDLLGRSSIGYVNMNDRDLALKDTIVTDDEGGNEASLFVNRTALMIMKQSNDSVQNGIVHSLDAVLSSSSATVADLMGENPNITLFNDAMEVTGLADEIRNHVEDYSWNPELFEDKLVYSGAQWDYCNVPLKKKYGYTVFACPDKVLANRYGITNMQGLYDYGREIYGGPDVDVTDPNQADFLKSEASPLRKLIAYNMMPRKMSYEHMTTICTIETSYVNPTEWYPTSMPLSTMKIERLTVSRYLGTGETRGIVCLNRGDFSRGYRDISGIHVDKNIEGDYDNNGTNGYYFTTDGLADFGEITKRDVFNTRLRFDLYDLFPECANNSNKGDAMRSDQTEGGDATNIPYPKAPCYWFPKGYLENVKVNDDGIFLYQGCRNTYWSYEGDEFNLAGQSYDFTFNLPSVPSGTYQIRLGFCLMASRGICQFYVDGVPEGIPFDMRDGNSSARTGWFDLENNNYSKDEMEAAKKNMHNLGWYHGPRSIFNFGATGIKDGTNASHLRFSTHDNTLRYVIATKYLDENVQHTIRIKSVWAVGDVVAMVDYLELVPKSVYGVEGEGKAEDDW
ncbi:MAG: fasciclin domain-containing protein [Bacteroidaceae bacterium]|nr:fasciclin domain-containing protein [Bacteroidaceae bacterium]